MADSNGWISVKERLPELYVEVLAASAQLAVIDISWINDKGEWWNTWVTHWQSLATR